MHGKRLGFALRQVDQDVGDVARLVRQVDAGDHVGAVFRFGKARRLGVGGVVGQRVDRRALGVALDPPQRIGMDRDEQRGLTLPRQLHPLAERHEAVVGPRHDHAIFSGFFELIAQQQREIEHQRLFRDVAARRPGAVIDAAVTGIDHDDRPRIALGRRIGVEFAGRLQSRRRPAVERERAHEGVAVDGDQIEHQPGRLAFGGVEHEGLVDPHRLREVEHDARAALHDQAEAVRLDQPAPLVPGLGRQLEGHLRDVDHDPVGIGQREGPQIDLAGQVHHEADLIVVAAEPGIGRDRVDDRARAPSAPGPGSRQPALTALPRKMRSLEQPRIPNLESSLRVLLIPAG